MSVEVIETELTRAELDRIPGPVLVEFGAAWCGYCRALAPHLARNLTAHPEIRHLKIEDGPGQSLGRSFRVTLWPTLILLRDGQVVKRLVRPEPGAVRDALEALAASDFDATRN